MIGCRILSRQPIVLSVKIGVGEIGVFLKNIENEEPIIVIQIYLFVFRIFDKFLPRFGVFDFIVLGRRQKHEVLIDPFNVLIPIEIILVIVGPKRLDLV